MRFARALIALLALPMMAAAQTYPSTTDPRSGLRSGRNDAGVATSGMRVVSTTGKPAVFDTSRGLTFVNSDLAFGTHYVYQANFAGFSIWDVTSPDKPTLASVYSCITSQGDPTIVGNLLFLSAEGGANRNDCAKGGVTDMKDHMAGVRIFDVSNPRAPKLVKNVQTCKGSHTNTLVPHPTNKRIVYIYVSGQQAARTEMKGCVNKLDPADATNSLYQLDVIKVDLDHPERAEVIPGARVFTGLDSAPQAPHRPAGVRVNPAADTTKPQLRTGPRNCHDVTAYPAVGLLAGACGSHGLLIDITNPEKPYRLHAQTDTNFQGWHTALFSNDGRKVVFTDEWGGGTSPMCQANSMMEMGGNKTLVIGKDRKMTQHAYFKIPTAQTAQENCVSHNGGLIPVPGRDVMVQGWYQGGVNIIDFTNADKPFEIGYFDRGPIDPLPGADIPVSAAASQAISRTRGTIGGSWGAYYWNGYIYSSEMDRGLDIMELQPSAHLSANEIAAAKLVTMREYNPTSQPKLEWPAAFVVVRAYLDQLVRDGGLAADRTTAIAAALDAAEQKEGVARGTALTALARLVDGDVAGAKDQPKVRMMIEAIRKLAAVSK
jgi:hypothetical protein